MTVLGIWSKADTQHRAEAVTSCFRASATWVTVLGVVVLSCLSGCGKAENTEPNTAVLPSVPLPDEMSPPNPSSGANGLMPLPTREQVLSSVPEGRTDPFAPIALAATAGSSQIDSGLRVQGVVAVGGELRALVSFSEASGTVCVGARGRCPGDAAALLPAGWAVQSIDLGSGCLSLAIAGQSQRRCIA